MSQAERSRRTPSRDGRSRQVGQIAVVGSANADFVVNVSRQPAAGETLRGSSLAVTPGGKGANQAVAAAKLGSAVAFVGCLGRDAHGDLLYASLTDAGVDPSGLTWVDTPTGVAVVVVSADGENSIIAVPGANACLTPQLAAEQGHIWRESEVVVLQLEIPLPTVHMVATQTSGRVIVNYAPAAAGDPDVLAIADPLVVNETEASFLLGEDWHGVANERSLFALRRLGARSVVLTSGAAGSTVLQHDSPAVHIPARSVRAVDATGAGDAFVGAIASQLSVGSDLIESVVFATEVAAVAVTRQGAQKSYPIMAEIRPASLKRDYQGGKRPIDEKNH